MSKPQEPISFEEEERVLKEWLSMLEMVRRMAEEAEDGIADPELLP